MKSFIYILLTSLTFLVVGCQNESEEIRLINQAERLFDAYPDSVITTLDSIPLPEEMSPPSDSPLVYVIRTCRR